MVKVVLDIAVVLIGLLTGILIGVAGVLGVRFGALDAGLFEVSYLYALIIGGTIVAILALEAMGVIENGDPWWIWYIILWYHSIVFSFILVVIIALVVSPSWVDLLLAVGILAGIRMMWKEFSK